MFEFFFKYSPSAFSKGHFVFLTSWPVWLLALLVIAAAVGLFYHVRRNHGLLTGARPIVIWLLETALVALVLLLLWHPALSVATLRPQQNVITVLMDHSRSMGLTERGSTRLSEAVSLWNDKLAQPLTSRFQVRLYEFGKDLERAPNPSKIQPDSSATHINDTLNQIASEAYSLPVGAIVLMSDGSDNSGGIDLDTISHIRQQRIPIHTIGFGRETVFQRYRDLRRHPARARPRQFALERAGDVSPGRLQRAENAHLGARWRQGCRIAGSTFKTDGASQTENITFNAGAAGPRTVQVTVEPIGGEENKANNTLTRLVNVTGRKMRILYVEGEPRWEFKFIRRAVEDDPQRRNREHAAHHAEQDLPPGVGESHRAGSRLPHQSRRLVRL